MTTIFNGYSALTHDRKILMKSGRCSSVDVKNLFGLIFKICAFTVTPVSHKDGDGSAYVINEEVKIPFVKINQPEGIVEQIYTTCSRNCQTVEL